MKFFAVFAAVLALAAGSPHAWTLQELSDALQNPHTNPEYIPYLEHALNQMMEELHADKPVAPVAVIMPTASQWTLEELSNALQSPTTDPAIVPYLEDALNAMMDALFNGQHIETMPVVIPVELAPVQAGSPIITAPVIATPVLPTPILPEVVPAPVIPSPEVPAPEVPAPEAPAAAPASSPLVQIIVNINQQEQVAVSPVAPEIAPTPVIVVDEAENISVNPVDVIAIQPPM
ncbi:PREDICTED: calphotin-like [Papilio polytes]|uniref:calphotin-like n=1 Tax=Papilio polytes TaxID=76194 RepID=UPI0006766E1A|nr:PREDICTED: calphotin-like [Papilio polytes]